jgi:hypothetical protein
MNARAPDLWPSFQIACVLKNSRLVPSDAHVLGFLLLQLNANLNHLYRAYADHFQHPAAKGLLLTIASRCDPLAP